MKKTILKFSLVAMVLAVCLMFSGCGILKIYVDRTGVGSNTQLNNDLNVTATYGKTYDVKSVTIPSANKAAELEETKATAAVYEAVVTIQAAVSGGAQIGSGVIVDIDVAYSADVDTSRFVYIITCHHVIEGSNAINVFIPKLIDEKTGEYSYYDYAFAATLMGGDKETDIAVLRIEINDVYDDFDIDDVVKVPIAGYDLQRGEDIFAIGCPTGNLPGSVSYGKVSNLYVEVDVENVGVMTLHQTDAATNSGNSGGGIFNLAGQLVGILNAGAMDYDGISFFIPVTGDDGIKKTATALISTVTANNHGYIEGKWKLGATFSEASLTIPFVRGTYIYVADIETGGALYAAGVRKNDYILTVSYTLAGQVKTCNLKSASLAEFIEFYNVMKNDLHIGDEITVEFTSSPQHDSTVRTVKLTQYIYSCDN